MSSNDKLTEEQLAKYYQDIAEGWGKDKKIEQQILVGIELYKRLAEFSEGIIKGMVHVMPEEKYLDMQKEIESRTTSIVHNENLRLVSELDELKKVIERNNNTFDSLHKERDGLNVRVSRLLSENQKLKEDYVSILKQHNDVLESKLKLRELCKKLSFAIQKGNDDDISYLNNELQPFIKGYSN